MNQLDYKFKDLFNKEYGNITNKHITKNLKTSGQSNLRKPYFFVEGDNFFSDNSLNRFKTGMKYNIYSKNNKETSNSRKPLIKAKKVMPDLYSHWEIKSYLKNLHNQKDIFLKGNKLSLLAKNELQKYSSKNINFAVPVKSKVWKKIKGGYTFKLGTSMYFLPISHFENKKTLLKYRRLIENTLKIPNHFSLLGNRTTSVILQSNKGKTTNEFWKLSNQIIFKKKKQFSKKSKFIVSQKEIKKMTSADSFKYPVNRYNSSYYGKHLVA